MNVYSNQALCKRLAAAVAGGHLCHAYLFYGSKGIGKKTLAREFARAILCRGEGDRPCGMCSSCHKLLSGNHPDFYSYEGKTGANAIHIDLIRELRSDAYIRPNDGDYKVYLLPGAEDMSVGAANALLKVLEEPPAHAVFLLTANNRDMVPLTIRSRCIQQELYPMTTSETAAALLAIEQEALAVSAEGVPPSADWGTALSSTGVRGGKGGKTAGKRAAASETSAKKGKEPEEKAPPKAHTDTERLLAAELSGGNLGEALLILNDENYADLTAISRRIAEGIRRGSEYEVLAGFSMAVQSKERVSELLSRLSALLRAALLEKLGVRKSADDLAAALAFRLTSSQMKVLSELLEEGIGAVDGNVNLGALANYMTARIMKTASE